jgi:UPF0271 protein
MEPSITKPQERPDLARAIAEAVRDVDEELVYFGLSGSVMIDEAEKLGLRTASEVFSAGRIRKTEP